MMLLSLFPMELQLYYLPTVCQIALFFIITNSHIMEALQNFNLKYVAQSFTFYFFKNNKKNNECLATN